MLTCACSIPFLAATGNVQRVSEKIRTGKGRKY